MSDLDDDTARHSLRLTRINQKGLEVATRLAALKAGQNITLADMLVPGIDMEAITKEARVRAFLDLINASRTRLATEAYGRCLSCGCDLDPPALDETPWLERCVECAAAQAPLG
jgi:hypothetical protein